MSELHIEGAEHEHGHGGGNKKIAILIAVLAALLALSETAGKSAQTAYLTQHIEASNLWAFFQAKTIRQTVVHTAMEATEALTGAPAVAGAAPPASDRIAAQIAAWRANAERWESEPSTQEGRRELSARATAAEHERERALATYHQFEVSSAAYQLAIVLASASIVTGVALLAWVAGGLGLVGVVFSLLGWFAPTLLHL
jgi:hypothetical protein